MTCAFKNPNCDGPRGPKRCHQCERIYYRGLSHGVNWGSSASPATASQPPVASGHLASPSTPLPHARVPLSNPAPQAQNGGSSSGSLIRTLPPPPFQSSIIATPPTAAASQPVVQNPPRAPQHLVPSNAPHVPPALSSQPVAPTASGSGSGLRPPIPNPIPSPHQRLNSAASSSSQSPPPQTPVSRAVPPRFIGGPATPSSLAAPPISSTRSALLEISTFDELHRTHWSKIEVTDIPTNVHGVYNSTESDKHAPLVLGSAAAASVAGSINSSEAIKKMEEEREKKKLAELSAKQTTTSTSSSGVKGLAARFEMRSSGVASSSAPMPPPKAQPTTAPSRMIAASMTGAKELPQTWIKLGQQVLKCNSGRCFSLAGAVVALIVRKIPQRIEIFGSNRFDHYFVVVGRPPSTSETSTIDWGAEVVILDAWQANLDGRKSAVYTVAKYPYQGGQLIKVCTIQ